MKGIAYRLEKGWKLTSVEPVIEHLKDLGILLIEKDQTLLAGLRRQSCVKVLGMLLEESFVNGEGSALGVCQMMFPGRLMQHEVEVPDRRLRHQLKATRCRYY
jgi:hypothetical protein